MLEKIICPFCNFEDEYEVEYDDDGYFVESPICKHCGEFMDIDYEFGSYGFDDDESDSIDVYSEV